MAVPQQQQPYFKPVKIINNQAGTTVLTLENGDKVKLTVTVKAVYQHMMPDKKTPIMSPFGKFVYTPEAQFDVALEPKE